jgi:hypothetical protein
MNLIRRNFLLLSLGAFVSQNTMASIIKPKPFCRCGLSTSHSRKAKSLKQPNKWGKNELTYYIMGRDYDLAKDVWDEQFRLAFDSWSRVSPLRFTESEYPNSDIIIGVGNRRKQSFGKRGGVLAWAQLPYSPNFDGQLLTMYDMAENWITPNSNEYGTILQSVAAHEIGHLLGLDHSNDASALMYPYINNALGPQETDIKNIQNLYGKK